MKTDEVLALINTSVRALNAYHLEPEDTSIKLNQNENPFDWPLPVKNEIAQFCIDRPWNRYPNFIPETLKTELARYAGVAANAIIAGNGSNEMLLVLLLALIKPGSTVIICQPTFTVYRLLVTGLGARELSLSLDSNLQYNVPSICSAVEQHPHSLLVLCTPNNPTGSALTRQELRDILDRHSGICILDQAYVEFGGYNAVPLLDDYPNLIITRTFSKAFAAAGLRLGYLMGHPSVVGELNKIKLPYNINFFTEHVATVLLKNRDIQQETITLLIKERDTLLKAMHSLPFERVYPSAANFFIVRTPKKPELFLYLKQAGILVRDVSSYPLLENCLRISIGSPGENIALVTALRSFFLDQ